LMCDAATFWNGQWIIQITALITASDTMITNMSIEGQECFASLSMAGSFVRNYATMGLGVLCGHSWRLVRSLPIR
jgi:hypothetical protein